MKADQHSSTIYKGPTTRERIEALAEHSPFFEHTAQHPQTVIHERFPEPWTMIIAYVEGEVHRCYDAANEFIWKNSGNVAEEDEEETLSADFSNTMDNLGDVLLRHVNVVSASKAMATAPYPSMKSMNGFRVQCGYHDGISRAANGELLSSYGEINAPVPVYAATIWDEDFEPIEQAIVTWLMNPFLKLIVNPLRRILFDLPLLRKKFASKDREVKIVRANTITAFARAFVVVIAILSLTAAVFTLQAVEGPKVRIMAMGMFAQVFILPMQLLGSRSLPLYTLITAWFQVMVMFIRTT